jgi:hypothetical protein
MWTAIGAAGGILAYRKGKQLLEQAQEQGVLVTAQQAGATVAGATAALMSAAARAQASGNGAGGTPASTPRRSATISPQLGAAAAAAFRKANS